MRLLFFFGRGGGGHSLNFLGLGKHFFHVRDIARTKTAVVKRTQINTVKWSKRVKDTLVSKTHTRVNTNGYGLIRMNPRWKELEKRQKFNEINKKWNYIDNDKWSLPCGLRPDLKSTEIAETCDD